jgi:hypothetical protein
MPGIRRQASQNKMKKEGEILKSVRVFYRVEKKSTSNPTWKIWNSDKYLEITLFSGWHCIC